MDTPSIQSIFCMQTRFSSPLERAVCDFLVQGDVPLLEEIEDGRSWKEPLYSEEVAISNWKRLLTVNFLCKLSDSHLDEMGSRIRIYEEKPWNHQSQYFRALVSLNHTLIGMPIPAIGSELLSGGAALIDLHEYRPWLSLPLTPQHFEYGIFLGALALVAQRDDLKEQVLRMAHWQMNTLDGRGCPLSGLFVRECDGGQAATFLALSHLLFRMAGVLERSSAFDCAASASMERLLEVEKSLESISPLWPLLERWLFQQSFKSENTSGVDLGDHIHDPSTALVGWRKKKQHVICTLHGEHTGLGALCQEDVEVVSYGPQYFPLEDCRGFGIEGNILSDHGQRKTLIDWRPHCFSLKGCTRLVDQPASSPDVAASFRGIWLDVQQEYKPPFFNLRTTLLSLEGWESVGFSFFVKASLCRIGDQVFKRNTLERYEGEVVKVTLEGVESKLDLEAVPFEDGRMSVIPLAGSNNFWGADFLIAFILSPNRGDYQWRVGPFDTRP